MPSWREAAQESGARVTFTDEVESARVQMVEVRMALDDYETLHGHASSAGHSRLTKQFNQAANTYLRMSQNLALKHSGEL